MLVEVSPPRTVRQYYFFQSTRFLCRFSKLSSCFFQSTHKSMFFPHSPKLYHSPYHLVGRLLIYPIDSPLTFFLAMVMIELAAQSSIKERWLLKDIIARSSSFSIHPRYELRRGKGGYYVFIFTVIQTGLFLRERHLMRAHISSTRQQWVSKACKQQLKVESTKEGGGIGRGRYDKVWERDHY